MNPEELARLLGAKFLEEGCYEALGTAIGGMLPQAATDELDSVEEFFDSAEGVAALAVQSVAVTEHLDPNKVIIYVTKGTKRAIRAIPPLMNEVPVEVSVMGKLKPWAALGNGFFFERNGRIACGSSCAPGREQYAGTFGALITDGAAMFALSNNHVLASCNHTPHKMPIMAPANLDSTPNIPAPREFAKFSKMIELRSGVPGIIQPMRHDAACAEITDEAIVSSWQGDNVSGFDTPNTVVRPRTGMRVKKFGRTTGFTEGVIESFVPSKWVLPYQSRKFNAEVWYENTWLVEGDGDMPFALGGDSGSLVVNDAGEAVGLVFAGNSSGKSYICSLDPILAHFGNLTLVSGHGL